MSLPDGRKWSTGDPSLGRRNVCPAFFSKNFAFVCLGHSLSCSNTVAASETDATPLVISQGTIHGLEVGNPEDLGVGQDNLIRQLLDDNHTRA
jgi:hypothetical protein